MSATSDLALTCDLPDTALVLQCPPNGDQLETHLNYLELAEDKKKYRNWFLTINNPTQSDQQSLNELEGICRYAVIAKEVGKECGTTHYHVVAVFQNQVRFGTVKAMFPRANIQVTRSLPHAIKYVKKDGDFVEVGKCPRLPGEKESNPLQSVAERIRNGASLRDIANEFPVATIRYHKGIAELIRLTSTTTEGDRWYGPYQQPDIKEWTRTHIVSGEPGLGKSQWAKQHFEPGRVLVVSHMDDLLRFNPETHDGIIFDDMSFRYLPRSTQIHLVDQDEDRSIHCRYQCAQIPANTKKIMTCNPNEIPVDLQDAAIARRCNLVNFSLG